MSVTRVAMIEPGTLALFAMTSGELLGRYLDNAGIDKAEFGRRVGGGYLKAHRWCLNKGFNARNRRKAEAALGLPSGYFDRPDDDNAAREREAHRRIVFEEFMRTDIGRRLDPHISEALKEAVIPAGRRATVEFYVGLSLVYQGQLTEKELDENLDWNENESQEIASKSPQIRRK
jgi:hypothetical protein